MRFGVFLVERGVVSPQQLFEAISLQVEDRVSLGQLALRACHLTKTHVLHILSVQSTQQRLFGQIALELGYLDKTQLADLLLEQDERLRPVSGILVAMGVLTQEQMEIELRQYRQHMADTMDPSGVLRTVV